MKNVFYIYSDNELHEPPADKASIPVQKGGAKAWLGQVYPSQFGGQDIAAIMNAREYCIVWVETDGSANDFLSWNGWERVPDEEGA